MKQEKQEIELGQFIATSHTHTHTHTYILEEKNNGTTSLQVNFYERALQFIT